MGADNQDVKEETEEEKDVKEEEDVKEEVDAKEEVDVKEEEDVKEEMKAKTGLKLKPTSERLKDERPEEPLVREESVLKNKPVMRGGRKTDKSEIDTGEN